MAKNVRNAVFETNSSSSHSVTVSSEEIVDTGLSRETLRKGIIEVRPHSYGWGWKRYYTPEEKIGYLLAQTCADFLSSAPGGKDCAAELKGRFRDARTLIAAVEKVSGCQVAVYPPVDKRYGQSVYIDHQSVGVGRELFGSRKRLAHFVLSRSSFVQTGNDNSRGPEFITTDVGTSEELHPGNYAAECPHETSFTLWADGDTTNVRIESGELRAEAKGVKYMDRGTIEEAFSDIVCVSAKVYMNGTAGSKEQVGRDLLHEYLCEFNLNRAGAIRLLRGAMVETFEVGGARRPPDVLDTRFELRCRAPEAVVRELANVIASVSSPAPAGFGARL